MDGLLQGVVSRINTQLLKMVVVAEHVRCSDPVHAACLPSSSNPPSSYRTASIPALPVYNPTSRCSGAYPPVGTSPMTIFYNGTVTTFDVLRDNAEVIMRMAEMRIADSDLMERLDDSMSQGIQIIGCKLQLTKR